MGTGMNLRKWYGGSIRIPGYKSHDYHNFLTSCLGIVRTIFKKEEAKDVQVRFCQVSTGSADRQKLVININADYAFGIVNGYPRTLESDEAISLILGIKVHEAAHFAYSPATLEPFGDYVEKHTTAPFNRQFAHIIGNIVEDIYIEAEVERSVPSLFWMLLFAREVYFNMLSWEQRVTAAMSITQAPQHFLEAAAVADVAILAKVDDSCTVNPYVNQIFYWALSAREMQSQEERFELTNKIYTELMKDVPQEECEDGSGEERNELDKAIEDALKKLAEEAKGLGKTFESMVEGEGGEVVSTEKPDPRGDTTGKAIASRKMDNLLDTMENTEISIMSEHQDVLDFSGIFMERFVESHDPVQLDPRYLALAEMARQRATVNRPYGLDMARGHHIRKLHRIATDSKIFAEPAPARTYKPLQVVILLDCSGSMDEWNEKDTRINMALQAGYGAAVGLVEGRCSVAVYGHTADMTSSGEVTIYNFKEFHEPIHVLAPRLGWMKRYRPLAQNKDGFAIRYVAQRFQSASQQRLLIVISDGQPYAPNYRGDVAIDHTRDSVNWVREQKIEVLSISITSHAYTANNRIYGVEHNVYDQDPNVIGEIVRKLIMQ